MKKKLGLIVYLALIVSFAAACEPARATIKAPFPLKAVTIEGQDGQYVADAITAEFLKEGAVFKNDGVDITGSVDWTTNSNNVVIGIKLNLRGIRQDGMSVASAVTMNPLDMAMGQRDGQGSYVRAAARAVVEQFRRQVLQQQNYLPGDANNQPRPLR